MADSSLTEPFEFAGWGDSERITDLTPPTGALSRLDQAAHHVLGPWRATAICGNDITSSCLYVSALCAAQAGVLAPLVLLGVAGLLYLYRRVYAEVGSALPLNGGTYTVLLNTTNKRLAAAAACLTLLSYVATAVISASEAMHYAHGLVAALDVNAATYVLLALFALLTMLGIGESSAVALVIFTLHILTLTLLSLTTGWIVWNDPSQLFANWQLPDPRGALHGLFFGFAAGMLGISGFESSANFIEEQKRGVFPKTLRNMWLAVAIFNPLISFLSIGVFPLDRLREVPPDLLSQMGGVSAGPWLASWVGIDAVLVLSGAVLTSFVGVTGLMRRMSLDRCLPRIFLRENRWRGTNHWIQIVFFAVCASILAVTRGQIETLAGVYTLSFLSVMALFAVGNMLLKVERGRLPRETRASWPTVTCALAFVLVGLLGNMLLDPRNLRVFATYYAAVGAVVAVMFLRLRLLRLGLGILRAVVERGLALNERVRAAILKRVDRINRMTVVYFTAGDNLSTLNRAALYVLENEQTNHLKIVHVYENQDEIPRGLALHLHMIDRLYPQLRVDFLAVKGTFGPELIEALSKRLRVPKNYMFIGTPSDHFPHRIEDLGGVRVIL
ncbi:MAG: APC family permease [Myxococcota bacterium]